MMPLNIANLGEEVVITGCHLKGDLKRHIDSLGLIVGERIVPISKSDGGLIIKIKDGRFAINNGVASKIFVS